MIVDENYLIEDLENVRKTREVEEKEIARQRKINDEYSLYRCFCKLCGFKIFEYSSLLNFQNYCKENLIQLI